ncbi:hypothetical protein AB7M29_004406 [Pseudomonas sp. F-14 TE3623]
MPTENQRADQSARDERLVTLPMWIIEAVRAEVRLEVQVWTEMNQCVDASLARDIQVLPCDVKLPPGTLFSKGTKVRTLMMAIEQRKDYPVHAREFTPQ